jgi:hypothetical protein
MNAAASSAPNLYLRLEHELQTVMATAAHRATAIGQSLTAYPRPLFQQAFRC